MKDYKTTFRNKHRGWEKSYYRKASSDKTSFNVSNPRTLKSIHFVKKLTPKKGKLLEIGCGLAGLAEVLSEEIQYTGLDSSEYALKKAMVRVGQNKNVTLVKGEANNLPFDDSTFDMVYAKYVLEHLDLPRESLKDILRVLKPNGYLVILAPNLEFFGAFPTALRHYPLRERILFHLERLADYLKRIFGVYLFRTIPVNYLDKTGNYDLPDDDLRYIVSAYEVIEFLKKEGVRLEYIEPFPNNYSLKNICRRLITFLPAMKYYGRELFIVAKNNK